MKKWSDRAEVFTRGGHNAYPGVFFFVFNFNLSVKSYKDFRVKNKISGELYRISTIKIEGSKIFSNKKNTPG